MTVIPKHSDAPAPNRRPRFPLGSLEGFEYRVRAPLLALPASLPGLSEHDR